MIKKKGFTLVELLAVIVIIGLISLIAVPNIVGMSTKIRNDQVVADAKKLVSLAKYLVNKEYVQQDRIFYFDELNKNGEIGQDPDGGAYDMDLSRVEYTKGTKTYCVTLIGSKRAIGDTANCVNEDELDTSIVREVTPLTP